MPTITARSAVTQDSTGTTATSPVQGLAPAQVETEQRQPDTSVSAEVAPKEATNTEEAQLSPKFAALARKERALRSQVKQLEAREQSLKALEAEIESAKSFKEKLTQNPLDALNELGITYDQLVNYQLNQPNPDVKALQQELKAIKDAQIKAQEEAQNSQKNQREQAISQIGRDAKTLIDSDPSYETIKSLGAEDSVTELIVSTFDNDGILLTIEDAAKQIEDYLVEEAMKLASVKKIKEKLMPQPIEDTKSQTAQKSNQIKTLTNAVAQTPSKPLSSKDRRERAIAAFKGELK